MSVPCPYCGKPMDGVPMPDLRPRMMRVYKAVLQAGPEGIERDDLLARMYAEDEWPTPGGAQVLRGIIHYMNRKIAAKPYEQRIVSAHRYRYKLVSLRDQNNEQKETPVGKTEEDSQGRHSDPQT